MNLLAALFFWAAFPAQAAPKLLVVVSVDQMRADYLAGDKGARYSGGLKILYEQGAVLTDAHHTHVPTETGPGHAAILTGKYPGQNGIVGNDWWDRQSNAEIYNVMDSVHRLGPENLLVYTLGDALKAQDPLSRVVSFSMKDRSAILLGGKKADLAVWFNKKKGQFETSPYYGFTPSWLNKFNAGLKPPKDVLFTPEADRLLLDLVEQAIGQYHLGEDSHADILAVSFSATDYIGHKYGPDSPQMKKQLAHLDAVLGELIGILTVELGKNNFDLVLTADHGVLPVPETRSGKEIKARRISSKKFDADVEKSLQALRPAPGQRWLIGDYLPNIYLNRALAQEQHLDWPVFLRDAAQALRSIDGVAQVYLPGEWGSTPDRYMEVYRRSYHPARSGDLLLRTAEGVLTGEEKTGTSHGTPYFYDSHVPLVFFGADFKVGLYGKYARVTDLAPTCARVLGVNFPPAEGSQVLEVFPQKLP